MTDLHPITPPRELVTDWCKQWAHENDCGPTSVYDIATKAAHWGADQELEACYAVQHTAYGKREADWLRSMRRPEPPNKKQRGLTALEATSLKKDDPLLYQEILNAIEGLPDD